MATIKFVNTRDAARRIAREEGVTWKDMGSTAPKGERWAVVFPEIKDLVERAKAVEMNVPTAEDKALNDALRKALNGLDVEPVQHLPAPESIVRETVSVLKGRKGQDVTVFTKRRVAVK